MINIFSNKIIITLVLVFASNIVFGCSLHSNNSITRISAQQAYEMMNELDDFVLIDARTIGEFNQQRIAGAISIPYDEINKRTDGLPYFDTVILVYCQGGRRSAIAANTLAELGFINIYDFGGIISWPFATI